MKTALLAGAAVLALIVFQARAEIAVSANDNKRVLENGVITVVRNPPSDTVAIIDLSALPPRVTGRANVPASVIGPPNSVAVTADERFALVSSAEKVDPADPTKTIPDNRVSVIDLRANPPRVTQTLEVGAGPSGLSINRAGTLGLVANRSGGTVSVSRLRDGQVAVVGTVPIGSATAGVSHAQFTPDGRHALVTRDGDDIVSVLGIEGETVTKLDRDITTGVRPYGVSVSADGKWAVVGNVGRSSTNKTGDRDTVSLVDLSQEPFHTVDTVTVGTTPEGGGGEPGRYARGRGCPQRLRPPCRR